MTRELPAWIEFRRDRDQFRWWVVCKACGLKEGPHIFGVASEWAHDHVAEHAREQDEIRAGS